MITCGVFIYDTVNKRVLCCRPYGYRKFEKLSIPKGMFDEGKDEDYLDAAYREVEEETGLDLRNMNGISQPIEFELVEFEKQNKKLKAYLCTSSESLEEANLVCNSFFEKDSNHFPEISEFHWLTLDEAKDRLHPTQASLIPKIIKIVTNEH